MLRLRVENNGAGGLREEKRDDTREGAANLNTGRYYRAFTSAVAGMQIWQVGL